MTKKDPKEEETVGAALVEIMREGFKNQDKMLTSINSKLDRLNTLESLKNQNEEKLVKFEAALNLLGGIGRRQEQAKIVTPNLNLSGIADLPWRDYNKGPGSWIFADTRGAEKLYDLIRESQANEVPIGGFKYKISHGRDKDFITRTPL